MKVARRFAEAFVFYEIGEKPARTEGGLRRNHERRAWRRRSRNGRRASRPESMSRRPASSTSSPGPRSGSAYTVSVSLLRVGVTSELRLEIEKENGDWVVTDVRG